MYSFPDEMTSQLFMIISHKNAALSADAPHLPDSPDSPDSPETPGIPDSKVRRAYFSIQLSGYSPRYSTTSSSGFLGMGLISLSV